MPSSPAPAPFLVRIVVKVVVKIAVKMSQQARSPAPFLVWMVHERDLLYHKELYERAMLYRKEIYERALLAMRCNIAATSSNLLRILYLFRAAGVSGSPPFRARILAAGSIFPRCAVRAEVFSNLPACIIQLSETTVGCSIMKSERRGAKARPLPA